MRVSVDLSEESQFVVGEPEPRDSGDLDDEVRGRVELLPRAHRVDQGVGEHRVGELGSGGGHADGGHHEGEARQSLGDGHFS